MTKGSAIFGRCSVALFTLALAAANATEAWAWHINTSISDPCHEQLTLGALGMAEGHWARIPPEPGQRLLEVMESRVEPHGVPDDRFTAGWIDRELFREGIEAEMSAELRYVLASFIAGVRAPDLEGHHPSNLFDLRERLLRDEYQHRHSIRRSTDPPGEAGDRALLEDTREWLEEQIELVREAWEEEGLPVMPTRWVLHGYPELEVLAFEPAYLLGRAAHGLQDSYSHTLRDDELRIITVLNFVDAIRPHYDEAIHGLAHSYRLDQCQVATDPFDQERFAAAQQATLDLFAAALGPVAELPGDHETLDDVLDEALAYRAGCDSGDFCGSAWLELALQGPAGPYSWLTCYRSEGSGTRAGLPTVGLLALWLWLKRRARHQR